MGVSGLQACCGGRWGLSMLVVKGTPPCRYTCGLSFAPFRSKAKCTLPRSPRRARFRCEREKHSRIPRKEWTEATCLQSQHRPWPALRGRQPAGDSRHTLHLPTKLSSFTDNPLPISHKPPCVCPLAAGIVPAAPCLLPAVPCATVPQRPSPAMPYAHGGEPRRIH